MGLRKRFIRMIFKHFGYQPATLLTKATQSNWQPTVTGNLDSESFKLAVSDFSKNSIAGTELCAIMQSHGSDKGRRQHNYAAFYYSLFASKRQTAEAVFEMGIGTNNENLVSSMGRFGSPGASLRGWRDFFSKASVYAGDIDRDILFNEPRIDCFYCDQVDKVVINKMWNNDVLKNKKFEVLIDDGLHTFEAGQILLENSFHKIAKDGFYIIEDILKSDLQLWKDYLPKVTSSKINASWALVQLPHPVASDNTLVVIQPK